MQNILKNKYIEPWYWGYAFQGAVVTGTAPILIPLIVNKVGNSTDVGFVVAAFYLGQLFAPILGNITDKTGRHKLIFLSGFSFLAIGCALFPFYRLIPVLFFLALLQGIGAAASNTVAGMFIVEFKPKLEWDNRIGFMQTLYGTGQAIGLGIVAILQSVPAIGMIVSAAMMLPGVLLGARKLPSVKNEQKPDINQISHKSQHPLKSGLSILHFYHRPTFASIKNLLKKVENYFTLYLISWFFVMFGFWSLFNLYPLIMKYVYDIGAGLSSLYFAIGATIGIVFYYKSGQWGEKYGDLKVFMLGIIMSLTGLLGMTFFIYFPDKYNYVLVPLSFLFLPVAWSPLIVAGTALSAQLSTMNQGAALGLFNSTMAIASVLSAIAAGYVAKFFGYQLIPPIASVSLVISLILAFSVRGYFQKKAAAESSPQV